ncbi:nucleotidyltransferase [Fimbriimonas ginsengisoli]|uniref:Nucleotidyltransferase family protein n=1 Tax=Fimbriimonas ginsengisoli Gsoil 348 TaxID=661478 RepID=A0A068NKN0_FIMGI|nr:nucleotidyltransferase [Fimbriimonas ginsengisoli]AIE84036.1 hypothetical protein OP10G_0668 [Fimbriimonas ginsengisoli Gsoil 348]
MNPIQPTREARVDWSLLVSDEEWELYRPVLDAADARGVRYALGGGLAFSEHSSRARNTKDIDLYILPADKDLAIEAVLSAGFHDLFDEKPYDRSWIYRGTRDGVIVDLIWSSPNHRMDVDESWLESGPAIQLRDRVIRLLPAEELIWAKLYIVQRDRCDWPDLLNILNAEGEHLDWRRLLAEVGERDAPLLGGLLSTFRWLCPETAQAFPKWVWCHLGLIPPDGGPPSPVGEEREKILDSRDWFGPQAA